MPRKAPLGEYSRKRDFSKTAEPPPRETPSSNETCCGRYVIQKHAASHLHYDFRLEMGGVLKSWAVPKGIPHTSGEKRLAMQVEDHPVDYAGFEGTIPRGEYGAGTVMVWDHGEYTVSGGNALAALASGKLHLNLNGIKLRGEWTLARMRPDPESEKVSWLLMKTGGSSRPIGKRSDDTSAISGRTMQQIASAEDATWHSEPSELRQPRFIPPMKPKLCASLPTGTGWLYELKFDGYRAIALKQGTHVDLYSRNEKRLRFSELSEAVAALPCENGIFDGEIIAIDENDKPSFQALQARQMGEYPGGEPPPIVYYLFDVLMLNGKDLRMEPLAKRKERLARLIADADSPVRFSANLPGTPSEILAQIKAHGLEGVVAKQENSRYEPGQRTGAWRKVKCINEQEFVIGGCTVPQGARSHFGALLLGYYEGGKLRFAGKVGTGFSEGMLQKLYIQLQKLATKECPFAAGLTPAEKKQGRWAKPELVCQVRFTEWTRDGRLRQPVFIGMRDDRAAAAIVRETA